LSGVIITVTLLAISRGWLAGWVKGHFIPFDSIHNLILSRSEGRRRAKRHPQPDHGWNLTRR
jgi:hypothetical protein